jgi:hypothetical protein
VNIDLQPTSPGCARLVAWTDTFAGAYILADTDIELDSTSRWTLASARHFAAISGGTWSFGRVLRRIRMAETAEFALGWRS